MTNTALKWWETAVIYQIYPRSYQDSNGDGIGDLPGITSRLDYIALIETAHELGLKVMIDIVPAHCSDQHAWFEESRQSRDNDKADWFHWVEPLADGSPPTNWLSFFGGPAWTWEPRRQQYYLHNFLSSQPNLNHANPSVREALCDVARFWFDRGVDGFRLDAVHTINGDAAPYRNNRNSTNPQSKPLAKPSAPSPIHMKTST